MTQIRIISNAVLGIIAKSPCPVTIRGVMATLAESRPDIHVDYDVVRNAINRLNREGYTKIVGFAPNASTSGRPCKLYTLIDRKPPPKPVVLPDGKPRVIHLTETRHVGRGIGSPRPQTYDSFSLS